MSRSETREGAPDADLAAIAAEITRSLRHNAVSSVPLRTEEMTGLTLSAAYLVERELWSEFTTTVGDERRKHPHVEIALTGPWPPYDFVRMQFGV